MCIPQICFPFFNNHMKYSFQIKMLSISCIDLSKLHDEVMHCFFHMFVVTWQIYFISSNRTLAFILYFLFIASIIFYSSELQSSGEIVLRISS